MRTFILNNTYSRALVAALLVLVCSGRAFAAATIVIVNADGVNEGFNDPTPAAPVGGNTGTTLGQQRRIAFQHAADIWGATLDTNQTIFVQASFDPLMPNVLGSAGATFIFSDFGSVGLYPGPEFPGTWYGSALADKRAGADLNPGFADIMARFNSNFDFYLGLDNNHGSRNDLVVVLLHEFAHGLNFQTFVNLSTGANAGPDGGQTDIYARHMLDTTTNLYWDQMTAAQRAASAIRFGRVVWDGSNVEAGVPTVLSFGSPEVKILAPASIAGAYQFGTAAFGPPITSLATPVTRPLVLALDPSDGAGPSTSDGCSPLTNAPAVTTNIALIDRGTCPFIVKVKNAQNAGAAAVIIANIAAGAPVGLGGVDPTIVIPAVSVTLADGNVFKANLPNVTGSIGKDPTIRAGADALGRARLFLPDPVQTGSSGSHYDSIAFRNLLMEPSINPDLTHSVKAPEDLTLELFRDVGWFADVDLDGVADGTDCSAMSDFSPTVVIGGSNTGVPNLLFTSGCTLSDLIRKIGTDASNHGQFASGVSHLTNELKDAGLLTGKQKGAIQSSAARASIP
jgi:hypothetical protein